MKTLKNCILLITALCLFSTLSYGQIVLASSKKKKDKETTESAADKEKNKKEAVAETEVNTGNEALAREAYAINPVPPIEETTPQDEEKPEATFTLSGSVDTYIHSALKTRNYYYGDTPAPSTSFADLKGFSLGMANVIFAYQGEKSGFVADLVFGPRGMSAVFGTATGQAIINQMYAYRKFNDNFTLNLGQFNTFLGYEVISPAVNFHYSTSYLFSWGPFNHTGLRADFAFGDGFVIKAAVMNPTDIVEFNPVNTMTFGGQFGYSNDTGGIWVNVLAGDQDGTLDPAVDGDGTSAGGLFQWDVTTGWNIGEKFYLGLNTSMQTVAAGEVITGGVLTDLTGDPSSFMGFAVYPKFTISDAFALGLRAEYFAIKNYHLDIFGLDAAGDGSVIELTFSGNIKAGGLTVIPEIRVDKTAENSFYDLGDDLEFGATKDMMLTFNLAAVYKF